MEARSLPRPKLILLAVCQAVPFCPDSGSPLPAGHLLDVAYTRQGLARLSADELRQVGVLLPNTRGGGAVVLVAPAPTVGEEDEITGVWDFPPLAADVAGPDHRLDSAVRVAPLSEPPERVEDDALLLEAAVGVHAQGHKPRHQPRDDERYQRHPPVPRPTGATPAKRNLVLAIAVAKGQPQGEVAPECSRQNPEHR